MNDFEYTKSDLIHICRSYGIPGYSKLNKEQIATLVDNFFKNKRICRKELKKEIDKNFIKFKNRKLKSKQQALAISYKNTVKNNNNCMLFYD